MQYIFAHPKVRKILLSAVVFSVIFSLLSVASSNAAVGINRTIQFQGKVVNKTDGTNVTDGNYTFVFKIYDQSSGGVKLWGDETQNNVPVTSGIFTVALGSVRTFATDNLDFNQDNLWLDVTFNGENFGSRIRLSAVPYAFMAEKVAGLTVASSKSLTVSNSLTFTGTDGTSFAFPTSGGNVVTEDSTSTLTGKTLTAPKFADLGYLADTSGNALIVLDSNGSAVNQITVANASTGNAATISASGETNVGLTILSKATGALTLDSGTTGDVDLGTGNNAKTINIGTGTGGNHVNIGTSNSAADTIAIGSALDSVSVTSSNWSISSGGALTVTGCSGCAGPSYLAIDSNGLAYPINSTVDFAIGGNSTGSAKFAVLGVNDGTAPTASISATTGGNAGKGVVLHGDGSIQSLLNADLTIGGDSTGNLVFSPLNGTAGNSATFNVTTTTLNGANSILTFAGSGNHDISASVGTLRLGAVTLNGDITGGNHSVTGLSAISAGTNPASAGVVRIPNASYITGRNAANNADVNIVEVDASNNIAFGANLAAFTLGGAVSGNNQSITGLNAISGTSLALGTNPAAAGSLRIPNATYITARNAANNADVNMVQIDASNNIAFGANLAAHTLGGAISGNSQNITALGSLTINGGGSIEAATSGTLTIGNAANTSGLILGKSGATTTFNSTSWTATPTISGLITDTTGIALGTTPAAAGILRIPNATYITARNAANNADINVIEADASGNIAFGANLAAHTLGGAISGNSQNITALAGLTINGGGSIEAATSGTLTIGGAANTTGLALAGNATTVSLGTSNTATTLSIGTGTGANIINIGTGATLTGQTQTIHIGDTAPAGTGKTNITIGNANANAGGLTLNSGTGGISFEVAGTGTTGYIQIGTTTGKATPDLFVVDAGTADPATTTNGSMYYNSSLGYLRCYTAGAWGNCAAAAATTTSLNNVQSASGNNTLVNNTNYSIGWDWSTLTTQTGLTFNSTSTGLTTGGILAIGSATTAYNHGNATETGSALTVTVGDSTSGTSTSTTNGLYINPEINVTGTSGTKNIIAINTGAPALTACGAGATCNYAGAQINLSANSNAGINQIGLEINSAGASSAGTVLGIDIGNITAGAATTGAIRIGSGYTSDIEFLDTAAVVKIPDGGSLSFVDAGSGTTIAALKEYFSAANYGTFEANGFINIDGSYYEDNFSTQQVNVNSNATGAILPTSRFGDNYRWVALNAGTGPTSATHTVAGGCAITQNNATLVGNNGSAMGMLQLTPETYTETNTGNQAGCRMLWGATGSGTSTAYNLIASKRYVQYFKVRPSANFTNGGAAGQTSRYMFWGANNLTSQPLNNTTWAATLGGIWMGNLRSTATNLVGGTVWSGFVRKGTGITTIDCGQNINTGTAQFALLRIEARDTNDVHFFVDNDVSNGISPTECGAGISSTYIPTFAMGVNMMILHATNAVNGATNQVTYFVDLYAHVQDDRRNTSVAGPAVAGASTDAVTSEPAPPVYDPILGADMAEQYVFKDGVNPGDIVSLGENPGEAVPASMPNDRKLLGVVSESPGLILGQADSGSQPVALSGRVKVRVNDSGGPIKIGDPITSSDIPGVGMRAASPGKIIGTAMENYSGSGEAKIMVNVNIGYYLGDEGDTALIEQNPQVQLGPSVLSSATDSAGLGSATDSATMKQSRLAYSLKNISESAINSLTVAGDFIMQGSSQFLGAVKFNALVEFFDTVVFHGNISIAGHITVDKDSAGYAMVKKGQRFVDITFDKEYENDPVVNASITIPRVDEVSFRDYIADGLCAEADGPDICQDKLANVLLGNNLGFAIQGKNAQGFMIILNRPAPVDITFSWQALAVKSVKTVKSDVPSDLHMPFDSPPKITTKFGERSSDGGISHANDVLGMKGHDGVDFALPEGTPIFAADDGIVEDIPPGVESYGTTIVIKHSWGKTYYGHLSEKNVTVGQAVKKGDKIGLSGSSGISTGPHLHLGMELSVFDKNNGYLGKIDPMFFLGGNKAFANAASGNTSLVNQGIATPSATLTVTPTPSTEKTGQERQDVAGAATSSAGLSSP
ncbi:MAG: peptidoglycan DD-metalloendopeptidase family protein [Candidatus Levyibacteriota bacterium]